LVFHNEPLKAPSFDTVLERNIEILHFPSPAKLQTCATDKLVLSPSHPGPTVIKIFPKSKVGENPKKSLAQMYENATCRIELGFKCVREVASCIVVCTQRIM
jgi:hypothetical protein